MSRLVQTPDGWPHLTPEYFRPQRISRFGSTTARRPGPVSAKQAQTTTRPPLCLFVGVGCLCCVVFCLRCSALWVKIYALFSKRCSSHHVSASSCHVLPLCCSATPTLHSQLIRPGSLHLFWSRFKDSSQHFTLPDYWTSYGSRWPAFCSLPCLILSSQLPSGPTTTTHGLLHGFVSGSLTSHAWPWPVCLDLIFGLPPCMLCTSLGGGDIISPNSCRWPPPLLFERVAWWLSFCSSRSQKNSVH